MSAVDPEFLDLDDALELHRLSIEEYGGGLDVPDVALLEAVLAQPRARSGDAYELDGLYAMAAAYLVHIARHRPFVDGNKRTALLAALTFLALNGITIERESEALYGLTIGIAEGAIAPAAAADELERIGQRLGVAGRDELAAGFAERVRRYCAFIERAASVPVDARIRAAREQLAGLVHAACQLPDGDADAPQVAGEIPIPAHEPSFGELDLYWEVFDPYEQDSVVAGSLTDDLLDVYADLRRGLMAYDAGHVGAALWEWRFDYDSHWGDHAVDALRTLQRARRRAGSDA